MEIMGPVVHNLYVCLQAIVNQIIQVGCRVADPREK